MSTLCFYAQFISSAVGANGLTVTWDVERITRADGTRSALVTGGATSITIGRRGLYGYLLSSADLSLYDYVATAITAGTADQKEIAAMWTLYEADATAISGDAVAGIADAVLDEAAAGHTGHLATALPNVAAGAAGGLPVLNDNLVSAVNVTYSAGVALTGRLAQQSDLSDPLNTAVPGSYTTGTAGYIIGSLASIDTSSVTTTTHYAAGAIVFTVAETFSETISGLTIPAAWTKIYFTVKRDGADVDADAVLQIVETNPGAGPDGILYLDGAAPVSPITYADGALTVTQAAGTVAIVISDDALATLDGGLGGLVWDLKAKTSTGTTTVLATGTASTEWTPTRTV